MKKKIRYHFHRFSEVSNLTKAGVNEQIVIKITGHSFLTKLYDVNLFFKYITSTFYLMKKDKFSKHLNRMTTTSITSTQNVRFNIGYVCVAQSRHKCLVKLT